MIYKTIAAAFLLGLGQARAEEVEEVPKEKPAFFLQDPSDGLCVAGDVFKRCAVDTLWYADGTPGAYSIHRRPADEGDADLCLDKVTCNAVPSEARLGKCDHCGAGKWNILGDSKTGYVLSEDDGKNCLHRNEDDTIRVVDCEDNFTMLNLQFASKDDVEAMSAPGARLITAASDGDKKAVKKALDAGVAADSTDWDQLTPLIAASSAGHVDIVKTLLAAGADVNAKDKDSITALMEASIMNHLGVVKELVKAGAALDAESASGVTALWLAAGEGRKEVVEFLLSKGAEKDVKRSDGITAVMAAAVGGHGDVVKALIAKGADIHAADKDGLTALMNASEVGDEGVAAQLLAAGADANALSSTGFTPLIVAAAGGHTAVLKTLVAKGATVNGEHPEGVSALMYASAGGHKEAVDYLLEAGAEVNALHAHGGSALMEAATAGALGVAEALLAAGADPMVKDGDGVTTLMSAAAQGHTEVAALLLGRGVGVNAAAASGGTALMFAAASGHAACAEALIQAGADVNAKVEATPEYIDQVAKAIADGEEEVEPHKDGVTALMVAAQGGHQATVELLLANGADIAAKDDEDMDALLSAVSKNEGAVAAALIQAGADPNQPFVDDEGRAHNLLMDAIVVQNEEFAALLIEKGADVGYVDEESGLTTLIQAAHRGQLEIAKLLLEKGVNVNAATTEGVTALVAACSEGHEELAAALLGGGADVNHRDQQGTSALMAAAVAGHLDLLQALLAAGAEVNAQNEDGHTALMFAYNGRNQVATLLARYADYLKDADDGQSKIIEEALEKHAAIVAALKAAGADESLQDKEGRTAADFDYKEPTAEELAEAAAAGAKEEL
mmetsp:Transcript_27879/g.45551  ORF Transcript_27879/g.45551 Transcript_27879/m.45551 type:complete len:847 (-) Transcript_27879:50-2590(-)